MLLSSTACLMWHMMLTWWQFLSV